MIDSSSEAMYSYSWLLWVLTPGQSNSSVTLPRSLSTQPYGISSNAFVSDYIAAGH